MYCNTPTHTQNTEILYRYIDVHMNAGLYDSFWLHHCTGTVPDHCRFLEAAGVVLLLHSGYVSMPTDFGVPLQGGICEGVVTADAGSKREFTMNHPVFLVDGYLYINTAKTYKNSFCLTLSLSLSLSLYLCNNFWMK